MQISFLTARCDHICAVATRSGQLPSSDTVCSLARRPQQLQQCRRSGSQLRVSASRSDDFGLVKQEEQSDGSILFVFGDAAEGSSAASAAADIAAQSPQSDRSSPDSQAATVEAASSPAEASAGEKDNAPGDAAPAPAAASEEPAAAQPDAKQEVHSEPAPAAEKNSASFSREQLEEMKVVELKDICREMDLKGYSALRKNELVEFILENA